MTISQMMYYKQQKGYSLDKLSELSGVPKGTIQKIFSGETKSPRYETLRALEEVLKPDPVAYDFESVGISKVEEPAMAYGKKQGEYTLEDYYALPEERRVELIDGVIYDMTAPYTTHQYAVGGLYNQIKNFIDKKGGSCMPFISPIDVQLDCDNRTMVQPDVLILCDRSKLLRRCIMGAPDFIIEILSPSTKRKDAHLKLHKYRNAGVREYWMVDLEKERVLVYFFEQDELPTIYGGDMEIPVGIYGGELKLVMADMFDLLRGIK